MELNDLYSKKFTLFPKHQNQRTNTSTVLLVIVLLEEFLVIHNTVPSDPYVLIAARYNSYCINHLQYHQPLTVTKTSQYSMKKKAIIQHQMKKMLKYGVIRPITTVSSRWFCVNYRQVNVQKATGTREPPTFSPRWILYYDY